MADAKRIEEAVLIFTQKVEQNVQTEEREDGTLNHPQDEYL